MDNVAAVWLDAVLSGVVTSGVVTLAAAHSNTTPLEEVSEGDIDTMIEQGIGLPDQPDDDAITTSANSTADSRFAPLVGPVWDYGHDARASTITSQRRVPGSIKWDWALVEPPSAVAASDHIGRRFLDEFRAARTAGFDDTDAMLLHAQDIHTEWLDAKASFSNPAYTPYSSHGRAINTDPATCPEDVRILLARLHEASPAYFWYVRANVIVGCGPGGRVPAMDMAVLCCQAAIFFVVASYAPWSEVRQNFRDAPRLGAPFALGILGRLMTSVLATSGVVFNIFLLDILCSFPGIGSLSLRTYISLESGCTTYVHSSAKSQYLIHVDPLCRTQLGAVSRSTFVRGGTGIFFSQRASPAYRNDIQSHECDGSSPRAGPSKAEYQQLPT